MQSISSLPEALSLLAPELLVCLVAIALLVYGAYAKSRAVAPALVVAGFALLSAALMFATWPNVDALLFRDMFVISPFTDAVKLLIALAATFTLALSQSWITAPQRRQFEYPVLLMLASFGFMLLVSANDFLALYMALELASLALYVMAAFDRDDGYSSEAGLKYFVLGSLASGMMLFGVSLLYGFTGTTNFTLLAELFSSAHYAPTAGMALGMVLMLVGLFFKVSAVPFHMWTPDVYEGAPTPVVAYFAVVPKIAALVLLARLLHEVFAPLTEHWQPIVYGVAIASMLVGAFGALRQTDLKRLLAYSSIGHVGYILMAVLVGGESGLSAMLIYLALYVVMSVGAFGFVMLMRRDGLPVTQMSELAGLSKTHPAAALFMALMMFSMAGIPPLAGFFGKFYVFMAALEAEHYTLVFVGLFASVVAAYYYLKLVKIMYFDEAKAPFDRAVLPLPAKAILLICALVVAFFFLSPTSLLEITALAVQLN